MTFDASQKGAAPVGSVPGAACPHATELAGTTFSIHRASSVEGRHDASYLCAEMMRTNVWVSCGLGDHVIFVVQPVQNRRRDHSTSRGDVMAGGDQRVRSG
jgi:hypothetical protein